VDVEEPLQLVTVSVAEQTHGSQPRQEASVYEAAPKESASPSSKSESKSDADNRRTQARYACRLGAEVYRTGVAVPHYCCLTDLSSGGCYLEVNLPFAPGSSVEIVVRTQEMKLRLRGSVQTSHAGYGMGIAFDFKAKDELANVKKLIDFVAATTDPS
jgi:hypothetical protein